MSTQLKIALTAVATLVLAVVLVVLLREEPAVDGGGYTLEGDGTPQQPEAPEGADPRLDGGVDPAGASLGGGPDGGGTLRPGVREPSGIDLSDPAVRETELRRLLDLVATDTSAWRKIAKVVALMEEPIPDDLREHFLNGLSLGPRRNQTMFAFAVLRDESFVEDLFTLLDDPSVVKGARTAVLTALWQMPAGNRDEVVRKLEGRFTGDPVNDQQLLQAANRRGGPEAARALTEYLQSLGNPRQVPPHVLRTLDLTDKQAAEVFATALEREESPQVLKALITTASQPGARELIDPLIALDRDGTPDDVRQQVMDALGRIGDTKSVDYLLRKAEEPGVFGDRAVLALGSLNTSARGVADQLAKALDGSANNPRPVKFKKSLLIALGNAKSAEGLRVVGKTLDDGDGEVRMAAVQAMGRMGQRARGYEDRLAAIYRGASESEKRNVVIALGSIGGEESIAVMRRMLKEEGLSASVKQTLQMGLRAAQKQLEAENGTANR